MFNWIARAFGSVAGAIDNTVRHWVHDLINGLYGFLHTIFGYVGDAWIAVSRSMEYLGRMLNYFTGEVVNALYQLFTITIPGVLKYLSGKIAEAVKFIDSVYRYMIREFAVVTQQFLNLLHDLRIWVVNDIWRPLYDSLVNAWHWITHEGYLVYYYITHPDKLVDLVWDALLAKIEHEAFNAGKLLGRFFLSLILHNLRMVITLAEDIITAIL